MKLGAVMLAAFAIACFPAHAQLRSLDASSYKAESSIPLNVECGTAFRHPNGSVELFHHSGRHVVVSGDRKTGWATVTRDADRWQAGVDANGDLHSSIHAGWKACTSRCRVVRPRRWRR